MYTGADKHIVVNKYRESYKLKHFIMNSDSLFNFILFSAKNVIIFKVIPTPEITVLKTLENWIAAP